MRFNKHHPYYRKLWWRTKLSWLLIDMGLANKGVDCEKVNAEHHWYNIDNKQSGCYYCKIIKEGKHWLKK